MRLLYTLDLWVRYVSTHKMAVGGGGGEDFVRVAKLQELRIKKRLRVIVKERVVALFYHKGALYALDHFCYRERGIERD